MLFSDLKKKQVINSCNGHCIGQVCDLVLDECCKCIRALVVPGTAKNIWERIRGTPDILIPIECVQTIGKDVILARIDRYTVVNQKEK